jgi:hypothetical protein
MPMHSKAECKAPTALTRSPRCFERKCRLDEILAEVYAADVFLADGATKVSPA